MGIGTRKPEQPAVSPQTADSSSEEKISSMVADIVSDLFAIGRKALKPKADPKTLDELAESYATDCDNLILSTEKEDNLTFVGGKLTFSLIDENTFTAGMKIYFQDAKAKWIAKERSSNSMQLKEVLKEDAIADLKKNQKIEYPLEKPAK